MVAYFLANPYLTSEYSMVRYSPTDCSYWTLAKSAHCGLKKRIVMFHDSQRCVSIRVFWYDTAHCSMTPEISEDACSSPVELLTPPCSATQSYRVITVELRLTAYQLTPSRCSLPVRPSFNSFLISVETAIVDRR